MEAKRSQSFRQAPQPVASKVKMTKTKSQASVTPSQMSENTRTAMAANAEKNPLDALSRSTMRRNIEKRSGLQDIDEEYLQMITNPPRSFPTHQHAAGQRVASTPQNSAPTGVVGAVGAGGAQLQNQPMAAVVQEQYQSGQNMQQSNAIPANVIPVQQQPPIQQQQQQAPPPQQQQQQQQQQQMLPPQQMNNYSPAGGEPEMCATCPHCQTVIYLAAPSPAEAQMNQASMMMHGQPEGASMMKS